MTKSPAIVGIVGILVGLLVGSFIFAGKTETDGQVTTVADSDATNDTAEKVRWKTVSYTHLTLPTKA